jgi:large subunit ribosomal protein L27Ae
MRTFHYKRNPDFCPTINIDRLWSLVPEEVYTKAKEADADKAPVIDVTKLGYFKVCKKCDAVLGCMYMLTALYSMQVLGKGMLPSIPLVVKAKYFSKEAEKKIKGAGGAVLLTA